MQRYVKLFSISILLFFSCLNRAAAQEELNWGACIKEAAKNHPDLIAAVESVKQSEAGKKISASPLFPQVSASVSASTSSTTSETTGTSVARDAYSYGVGASQLLFDGLKTISNVNAAKENIKASQQSYKFTSTQVRLRLRTAFINLLRAQELTRVTEGIVKIRRGNFELITLRYESGLEHRGALLTAEASLAEANFELAQAKRDLELGQRQLTKELGRKEFIPMIVKGDFTVIDSAQEQPNLEAIADSNPSLKQLTAQKNAAAFNIQSAYANFSPQISGSAGADKTGTHWAPRGDQWNLGVSLSLPLFEGGLRLAQVSQAQAVFNQLRENERSTRDAIIVNLEQAWTSLQDAIETVVVQNKQLIATEERSKIAEAEYATGFINYDNWTIIEDNLVSAKTRYLNAQANALLAEANWIQAKGEVLEYE
jgi:outer membrane protein TolC